MTVLLLCHKAPPGGSTPVASVGCSPHCTSYQLESGTCGSPRLELQVGDYVTMVLGFWGQPSPHSSTGCCPCGDSLVDLPPADPATGSTRHCPRVDSAADLPCDSSPCDSSLPGPQALWYILWNLATCGHLGRLLTACSFGSGSLSSIQAHLNYRWGARGTALECRERRLELVLCSKPWGSTGTLDLSLETVLPSRPRHSGPVMGMAVSKISTAFRVILPLSWWNSHTLATPLIFFS